MMKHIVSFGGGVQSTALALMCIGKDERLLRATGGALPDLFVFSDTGDEPEDVYQNVKALKAMIESAGFEFFTVSAGRLSEDFISGKTNVTPPLFTRSRDGGSAPVRRTCTSDYKVKPILNFLTGHYEINPRKKKNKQHVVQWLGISHDEMQRMKTSSRRWFSYLYPLVLAGMRRGDCMKIIKAAGLEPVRSACTYCPFHSSAEWLKISKSKEFKDVVAFEKAIHGKWESGEMSLKNKPFLHRSLVPIDAVDFEGRQGDMWSMDAECEGICGV